LAFHDFFHGQTDELDELSEKKSEIYAHSAVLRPELRLPEGFTHNWESYHRISQNLFKELKKPKMQAIEDIVEAYLGDLFQMRETVYPSDVAAGLDLDYDQVKKIFAKFVRQGKLKD